MRDYSLNFLFDRNEPRSRDLHTLSRIADAISIRNLPFFPKIKTNDGIIRVDLTVMNREDGQPLGITFSDMARFTLRDRESYPSIAQEPATWTYGEGVARIYQSILDALKHELDESFHFMSQRIFDPHHRDGQQLKDDLIRPECTHCGGGKFR